MPDVIPHQLEDRHTDARMRGLITLFARAAVALVLLTAPLIAPTHARAAQLGAVALAALVVAEVVQRTGYLQRCRHRDLFAILVLFSALISVGSTVSGDIAVYRVLQMLPVLFTAIYFTDWRRLAMPAVAIVLEYAVAAPYGLVTLRGTAVRFLLLALVAAFGLRVAEVLRESLRTHLALHAVLEAAVGSAVDRQQLVDTGLRAALLVTGWQMGAVILVDDDRLSVAATSGLPQAVTNAYAEDPMHLGDGSMSATIVETGAARYVPDTAAFLGQDHVLVQHGVVSMAGTPIPYYDQVIGVLITSQRHRREPDERERDRLALVAEQLGLALGNARAHAREAGVVAELTALNQRKDEFLAMVSHELRTPAAALELVAETFHERADRLTPEDMEHVKSVLLRRSRDLRQLIETLLDSAIADTGSARLALRPVSWRESLTTWSETVQAHTGREISLSLPPEDVITLADPAKMERVVANLLGNAAKFSPPGTAIWLGLRTTQGELVMTVADEGIGIPDEARGRIFERFVQVESGSTRETGGVGLGLYLVQEFVGLHGGTVGVASTGLGSAFTVRLPLVAAQPDESWDLPVHRRTGLAAAAS